jgi:5-methylcytosine-specific restriction endonuclease McrA
MKKKRTKLPNTLWGRLFQEAGHHCAFCDETVVSSLEIHHIDGNPSNNDFENLILACASCHKKITTGFISEADVRLKKRHLAYPDTKPSGAFTVEDIKGMRPSPDCKDPNDPIDWNHYFLKPEDM